MLNTERIENMLRSRHMTKAQLIKASGLTRVTIDKLLKGGEVTVSTLEAIAKGLGVSAAVFFEDEPTTPTTEPIARVRQVGSFICPHCGKPFDIAIENPNR